MGPATRRRWAARSTWPTRPTPTASAIPSWLPSDGSYGVPSRPTRHLLCARAVNPKPRWIAYDAKFFKVRMPANIPMTVQDRTFSSPIW
ncbi:DUF3604 domain-containing protein [Sphingobium sp. AN558]|uniref:DUF3604 domain-containing protein n=1 Tax=Sphingobium sp. AN558 TaxID=3133442 RepID=UPI004040B648